MFTAFKVDEDHFERLKAAAKGPMTKEERMLQRISFVFGNLPSDSTLTREEVEKYIREREGA